MTARKFLLDRWQVVLILIATWTAGVVAGQVLYRINKELAFKTVDRLDRQRKPLLQVLYRLLGQPGGTAKATAFVFGVNLLGGSLFQHTFLGLLLVPPFILLFVGGLLVSLLVRKYPERLLITLLLSPFEFGAFVIAATGGIGMGMSLWGLDRPRTIRTALARWATLFSTLVIPLQLAGALGEAFLARHLPARTWPSWLFEEEV